MDDFRKHLLKDVLAEGTDAGLRENLLGETLRLARRKRRLRQTRRTLPAVTAFVALLLIAIRVFRPSSETPHPSPASYTLVHTRSLPSVAFVVTKPLPSENLVATSSAVRIVETYGGNSGPRELNDDELLKFADASPVVLVRHGPNSAELVFVNAKEREKLLRD